MTRYDIICLSIRNAVIEVKLGNMSKEEFVDHLKKLNNLKEGNANA